MTVRGGGSDQVWTASFALPGTAWRLGFLDAERKQAAYEEHRARWRLMFEGEPVGHALVEPSGSLAVGDLPE